MSYYYEHAGVFGCGADADVNGAMTWYIHDLPSRETVWTVTTSSHCTEHAEYAQVNDTNTA